MGWAIHWLHPKSKRPIGNQWAAGPRKTWDELKETYQNGFNVGVRLGTPSEIVVGFKTGYLAVIDVDIKSTEKRHRQEALKALRELVGDVSCPEVRSGRGNGSRHLYCVTAKPFKTWNPYESSEAVRVLMPSKKASKVELNSLTEKEIKEGWRISKAWEISLYSDGRQVVIPPSIHPDTGKPYFWKEHLVDVDSLPVIDFGEPEVSDEKGERRKLGEQETVEDFQIDESLDIRWLPDVATNIRKLITVGLWHGKKIEDRSAYLLPAATGLVSAGLDKNGVLTVLTDRSTYMGQCAYDHAQTNSRKRAAKWLWNYTVKKVMNERDPSAVFEGRAVVTDMLDDDEAKAQAEEIEDESDWRSYLEKTKDGKVRNTFNNCKTILTNVCETKTFLWRNEFANNDYYVCDVPWGSKKDAAVTDIDIDRIKNYCCERFGVEFGDHTIDQILRVIADENRRHPVREWIKSLDWDGTPRLETWLRDYASATTQPEPYLRALSKKVLVALVKRVFEPGCKFDHVLILEGDQGWGKSTLLQNLVGKEWFTDQPLVIGEKDTVTTMQSKWLIELGELSTLNKSEVEAMKAFISQATDRIRVPYGKRMEDFPRQCIFVGSTNKDEYLKDETGNRRFWPVRCTGELRFEEIRKVREQLFAEAYAFYLMGEPIYFEDKKILALARAEQLLRSEGDEWMPAVRDIVSGEIFPRGQFEMRDVSKSMDQFGAHRLTPFDQQRIGKCLRALGFEKYQECVGLRRKLWRLKDPSILGLENDTNLENRDEPQSKVPPNKKKHVVKSFF